MGNNHRLIMIKRSYSSAMMMRLLLAHPEDRQPSSHDEASIIVLTISYICEKRKRGRTYDEILGLSCMRSEKRLHLALPSADGSSILASTEGEAFRKVFLSFSFSTADPFEFLAPSASSSSLSPPRRLRFFFFPTFSQSNGQ